MLGYGLKEVFDVGRGVFFRQGDDTRQIDGAYVHLGQEIFQNGFPSALVESPDRDDAIKSPRPQQGGVQLADVVGRADEQQLAGMAFDKRDLLEKLIGDGPVYAIGSIPIACKFFEFVYEYDDFFQVSRLLHHTAQVGADFVHSVDHEHARHDFHVPPRQPSGHGLDEMGFARAGRAEENDGFGWNDAMFPREFLLNQRENDLLLYQLLGWLGVGDGVPYVSGDGLCAHLHQQFFQVVRGEFLIRPDIIDKIVAGDLESDIPVSIFRTVPTDVA